MASVLPQQYFFVKEGTEGVLRATNQSACELNVADNKTRSFAYKMKTKASTSINLPIIYSIN